jgi:flavin-dependent dehydrogenase
MKEAAVPESDAIYDALVIGGGPAGSTAAALMAAAGKSVLLLEKDHHPRFHIGESLLPFNVPLLEKLGVLAEVERIGMPKFGIEFVSPNHEKPSLLEFAGSWHKEMNYSFQVRRSEFDHVLLQNAASKGATVIEGCRVTDVDLDSNDSVAVQSLSDIGETRHWRARFLIDASGRDTVLADRLKTKQRNRRHESAAIYAHFRNAERLAGRAEGNISVFWFDQGWFWFIPLSDGTTSVGAVCRPATFKARKTDVTSFLFELIARCPALAARLKNAEITAPATGTGNYSYECTRLHGKRHLMIGDAAGFIDPVFSTGVFLAMQGGFFAAEAILDCLAHPARSSERLRQFERDIRGNLARFSWFIYRVTSPAIRNLFMAPRNFLRMEEAVLALLSGDVGSKSPIRPRLALFKGLYYAHTFASAVARKFSRRAPSLSAS